MPKVGTKLRTDSKSELISHGVTSIAMHKILNHAGHFNTYTETLILILSTECSHTDINALILLQTNRKEQ